jgi:hypothetical protein
VLQASLPSYMNRKGRFHKGSCVGLRAWGLARLADVKEAGGSSRSKDKDKVRVAADIYLVHFVSSYLLLLLLLAGKCK